MNDFRRIFKVIFGSLFALLLLVACTPADIQYCRSLGVEGTAEYGNCLSHYQQQSAAFAADRDACDFEADATYPRSLYDRGHYARTHGGFGPHGEFYGGHTIHIDPDWQHNREVDRLRMRIIAPCMQARGWNSANDWQAGRHAVSNISKKPMSSKKLPWRKR